MPETAKILPFPARPCGPQSAQEIEAFAKNYLASIGTEGEEYRRDALLSHADALLSVCTMLRDEIEKNPSFVAQESVALYRTIGRLGIRIGSFDERDYFLGETALIAAISNRILGKRAETEIWLDRAEGGFRHTVNPSPLLANVTYQRLALRCESGGYAEVAELAPMLASSFARLNMLREHAKCVFLEAVALKQSGNNEAALARFEAVAQPSVAERDPGLAGLALITVAEIHVAEGRDELASEAYGEAIPLVRKTNRPATLAQLKAAIGETLAREGNLSASIEAFSAAIADYQALGMQTWVAYFRVVLAQKLLQASKPREAEWQILSALPTLDEQKMAPEGFAAIALLRESVRQRNIDSNALGQLREYLHAQK